VNRPTPQVDILLIKRLEFWAAEWVQIDLEMERLGAELAARGVEIPADGPLVGPWDSVEVARLKDAMRALELARERILKGLSMLDAILLDPTTLEILLPGGPVEGSFLSWQPGENNVCFWRENAHASRQTLPGVSDGEAGATIH